MLSTVPLRPLRWPERLTARATTTPIWHHLKVAQVAQTARQYVRIPALLYTGSKSDCKIIRESIWQRKF